MKVGASRRFGVPPLGGEAHANTMILKIFHALVHAPGLPAEAGTPNLALPAFNYTQPRVEPPPRCEANANPRRGKQPKNFKGFAAHRCPTHQKKKPWTTSFLRADLWSGRVWCCSNNLLRESLETFPMKILMARLALFMLVSIGCVPLWAENNSTRVALVATWAGEASVNVAAVAEVGLSKEAGVTLVERTQVERVLQEQKLSQSGVLSTRQAMMLGKLLGVDVFAALENSPGDQGALG
ncbi:MAG: hypothetical protein JWM68_3156, partial [Verrucomicrobiales bacterium]|nr:hypothetical protein [Verrucomicrobiales bacterium]